MASINNVINVSLLASGAQADRDNMNVVAIIGTNKTVLSTAERYRTYKDAASVAADFGAYSAEAEYANVFFGTKPNPVNAGGTLVIGYHRAATETVAATSATLVSQQLEEVATVAALQTISDGSFAFTLDGAAKTVTGLDFRTATSLDDVVALIQSVLDAGPIAATLSNDNGYLTLTSDATGATSTLTVLSAHTSGTFVGSLLGMASGSGAALTQGANSASLTAETQVEALTALKALVNFRGACFIGAILDANVDDVAAWAEANDTLVYCVFSGSSYYAVNVANPVWAVKLAGQSKFRCLYSASGNRKLAASYMARVHCVNFNAQNSALTMHLKALAVPAEDYSQAVLDACALVGLDVFTTIKNVPVVLTSGANNFVDNVYNLMAFINAVQVDQFNLLAGTATKIPQTEDGVAALVDQGEKTTRGFVRAGVFAPGTWTSTDRFGDAETFDRNIEQFGFYWLAGKLADQAQADRAARKSPVLQCAVKNAGAIHSADIIINFNA